MARDSGHELTGFCRLSPHESDDLDIILLGHSLGGIVAADVALLHKHRILGIVNFDVPFLGLHPRVVPTGIGSSIPKADPAANAKTAEESKQEALDMRSTVKPIVSRPSFNPPFRNDKRLANRGFFKSMMHFVDKNTEHFSRVDNLSRSVFDRVMSSVKFAGCVSDFSELRRRYKRLLELNAAEYSPRRVRFVNYYTASTGRIKQKANSKPKKSDDVDQINDSMTTASLQESSTQASSSEADAESTTHGLEQTADDEPSPEKEKPPTDSGNVPIDSKSEDEHPAESASISPSESSSSSTGASEQKLRTFILLPSHHWKEDDNSLWTPVLMENMDEVVAHQSMFIPQGARYERLVGDTVALIEQWIQSDLSRQLLAEFN